MTFDLPLDAETESKLREQAAAEGVDPVQFVVEAIRARLTKDDDDSAAGRKLSREQRRAELEAWIAGHKPGSHFVDDSRESIYEGRGE